MTLIPLIARYDVEYINYYTNLGAKLTTGFSGFYTKGNPFKPTRPEIIGVGVQLNDPNTSLVIKGIHQLYPRYTLQNLVSHRVRNI